MIDVQNMTFHYAGQKGLVFSNFSLRLEDSRIYGLLGKNGTGKSTLLYLIAGLLCPKAGEVSVDGFNPSDRRAEMLEKLFIVPEEFELPNMTLNEYVRMNEPFYPRFSREVLQRCLKEFELPTELNLQSLSMGQKKKAFMSFALATQTQLLLMDEPTNGLDIPAKSQFRKVMAECMTDDRTVIISTHQVHDIEQLLDHIVMIDERRLLLNESVENLTAQYTFSVRMPGEMDNSVIYAEPTLQGNMVMARREEGEPETTLNLDLLFNAVATGKLKLHN